MTSALTLGHVVLDEVWQPGATAPSGLVLGGAGSYAVLGQALALRGDGAAAIVSGVGQDFPTSARSQLREAGIDDGGLVAVDAATPRTIIRYRTEHDRTEEPAFGHEHFRRCDPQASMLQPGTSAGAIYLFAGVDEPAWDAAARAAVPDATVLWELDVAVCEPQFRAVIGERARQVEIVSVNEAELASLAGGSSPRHIRAAVTDWFAPAVLAVRMGGRGALLATAAGVWTAAPVPRQVVDTTGAGNAFSGALAVAWHRSQGDPVRSLRQAMAAAAITIGRTGPPLPLTDSDRADFARIADTQPIQSLTWEEFV